MKKLHIGCGRYPFLRVDKLMGLLDLEGIVLRMINLVHVLDKIGISSAPMKNPITPSIHSVYGQRICGRVLFGTELTVRTHLPYA